MEISFTSIMEKEVIVSCSGKKLGFPKDLIIGCDCGQIEALVLCRKGLSFFHKEDHRIPWCEVERIGEDIIWVAHEPPSR
ncbi:MAG: YlmC/YmxH family sporulation protein [Clostridiales bacterium]|nr:MAG: YlmC/YmxH family sporulation protein [Clostridiales bacterium]